MDKFHTLSQQKIDAINNKIWDYTLLLFLCSSEYGLIGIEDRFDELFKGDIYCY